MVKTCQQIRIRISKWSKGVTGADDCFDCGDKARYKYLHWNILVEIDSELETKEGRLVIACIVSGSFAEAIEATRIYLPAELLTPIYEKKDMHTNSYIERFIGVRCPQIYTTITRHTYFGVRT